MKLRSNSIRTAGTVAVSILFLLGMFHIAVIAGIVPGDMVWSGGEAAGGGDDTVAMEVVALLTTVVFAVVAAGRSGLLFRNRCERFFAVSSWIMTAWFMMNSLGNLFSPSSSERAVFLPVSLVLMLLSLFLALKKSSNAYGNTKNVAVQ